MSQKDRRKTRKHRARWILGSLLLLAAVSLLEPDFRATLKSNITYALRGYQRGYFSKPDDFGTYPYLLYTHFKLGLYRSFGKYFDSAPVKEGRFLGLKLRAYDLRTIEFGFRELFLSKTYLFHAEKAEPLIVDCGSNIGFSILYFKTLQPKAKIIGFEPSSTAFELLEQNLELNGIKNVTVHKAALSDRKGSISFYSDEPASLSASMFKERAGGSSETVDAVRLSDFIEREVDFLKIDVEGAEDLVLKDLNESRKLRSIREMVVEYHHHFGENGGTLSGFLGILEQNNFGYQIITGLRYPFRKEVFQDIMIYAYRK